MFLQTDYYKGNQIASDDNTGYNIVPRNYFTYRHMSDDEIFKFNINDLVDFGIVSTLYPVFTTNVEMDSIFLQYILNFGSEFSKFAIMQKQGGSRTYMYLSKLEKLQLTLPKFEEQQKIGAFFKSLDDTIALHQAAIQRQQDLKKAMLQKLFPIDGMTIPTVRFSSFSEEWEQRKLGEVSEYVKGFAFKSQDYSQTGIRVVRVSDLSKDSIKSNENNIYVSNKVAKENLKYKIYSDEIIITTVGSKSYMKESAVGRPIIIKESLDYLLNQNLVKIKAVDGFNSYFIYNSLLKSRYSDYISNVERGNANQANIAIADLLEYSLSTPAIDEQAKIGHFFKQLDETITLHQQVLEKLKLLKQSLLQKMFVN